MADVIRFKRYSDVADMSKMVADRDMRFTTCWRRKLPTEWNGCVSAVGATGRGSTAIRGGSDDLNYRFGTVHGAIPSGIRAARQIVGLTISAACHFGASAIRL